MGQLALIRHGNFHQPAGVPSAHLPHGLDELGRTQATRNARELVATIRNADFELDPVIDTSTLLRAYETSVIFADILAPEFGEMRVEQFDSLAERCLGSAANLTLDQIDEVVAADPRLSPLPRGWKATTDFRLPLPGAESLWSAGRRVADHLNARLALWKGTRSERKLKLVFGHGGAFRHAALHLGVLEREDIPKLSMYHCEPVILRHHEDNDSWSHVAGNWKVRPNAISDDV